MIVATELVLIPKSYERQFGDGRSRRQRRTHFSISKKHHCDAFSQLGGQLLDRV